MTHSDSEGSEHGEILAIMGRFFPFDPDGIPFAGKTMVIKETPNQSHCDEDGGTGLNVWDGAMLLARYLEKKPEIVKNNKILELGSGCGLVGIAAMLLGAKEVVMTDLEYALPLMKDNVQRNKPSEKSQNILCVECDWFNPPAITDIFDCKQSEGNGSEQCPDIILVADCVWLSPLVSPLLQTLKTYTTNQSTKVIITYQQRGRDVHEDFWHGLHEIFEVIDIDTEQTADLSKPDVFHVLECRRRMD